MRAYTERTNASVSPGERAEVLDALRGFALFGILIASLSGFTGYWEVPAQERAAQVVKSVS